MNDITTLDPNNDTNAIICKLDPECHYCPHYGKYFKHKETDHCKPLCLQKGYTRLWTIHCHSVCQDDILRWVK